ncbi:hypothetical protein H0I68_15945 [Yersinia kristensenii]|uniref:hypothetical protein n=1 Tax=Yersinia kristensenii TaxID=28152 RepID=UPI001C6099BA|nr:hypothetical protein [Yersinia kristensenii]MBW5826534.1 hypothetical protein [Yersinia kristensenii]
MSNQLNVYNDALRLVGERQLVSLTENREPRRLLDAVWDGALKYCLEQGQWNFAIRSVRVNYSPSVEPPFGYRRAFNKPDDYVRTVAFASDPFFNSTIIQYTDEAGFWFCDLDEIFIRYVSNDQSFGLDSSLWPETFSSFVAAYLATQIAPRLKNGSDREWLAREYKMAKTDALTKDAIQEPTKIFPTGRWVRSRHGGSQRDSRR